MENIETPSSETQRLDKSLVRAYPHFSRSFLAAKIKQGQVTVNGKVEKSVSLQVSSEDQLDLLNADALPVPALMSEQMDLHIVYEDGAVLVINKPAGLVVHPAPGNYRGTLLNGVLFHCGQLPNTGNEIRPGIVHRLDKETSGLIVVAKTLDAYHGLKAQFQDRSLTRSYIAFVWGVPEPRVGIIDRPMERHPRDRQRMRVMRSGGKEALTHYQVETSYGSLVSQVACQLKTGRTHQIRAHLANMGHGVLGDRLYGRPYQGVMADLLKEKMAEFFGPGRHCLHARTLSFLHPLSGEKMTFQADLPADIQACLSYLEANQF